MKQLLLSIMFSPLFATAQTYWVETQDGRRIGGSHLYAYDSLGVCIADAGRVYSIAQPLIAKTSFNMKQLTPFRITAGTMLQSAGRSNNTALIIGGVSVLSAGTLALIKSIDPKVPMAVGLVGGLLSFGFSIDGNRKITAAGRLLDTEVIQLSK